MQHFRLTKFVALAFLTAIAVPGSGVLAQSEGGGAESGEQKETEEPDIDPREELNRANRLAGRGALTRSISHYEKVLRAAAQRHPSAHFNLGEVLKANEEFGRALLHYQAYLSMGDNEGTKSKARDQIDQLEARVWDKKLAVLSVDIEPEQQATVRIDGFPVARNQDLEDFELVAGEYDVSAEIVDHKAISKTVELEHEGDQSIELKPRVKTFYGKLLVDVDREGAEIRVKPETLDAPREPNKGASVTSPVESPIELETGKWLVEATKEGYHKWVRYVQIQREKKRRVDIELQKKLPEEIR